MKVCIVQLLFMDLKEPHFLRKRTGKELKGLGSFLVMTYFHSKEEIQKHCRIFFSLLRYLGIECRPEWGYKGNYQQEQAYFTNLIYNCFSVFLEQVWADMNGDFTWLTVQLLSNCHLSQLSSIAHTTESTNRVRPPWWMREKSDETGIWYMLSETKCNFMNLLC